jgi:hypothetical protein
MEKKLKYGFWIILLFGMQLLLLEIYSFERYGRKNSESMVLTKTSATSKKWKIIIFSYSDDWREVQGMEF